jgi:hypothetical protein
MFYYIALKYGNFLLETLDTFPLLKDAYTQSRNYMKTGYPLDMVLYNKFWITFLSLNNCQLIKKFQNKQSRKYF